MYWYIYNHHGEVEMFSCNTENELDKEIERFLNDKKNNYFIIPYGKFEGTQEELLSYVKENYNSIIYGGNQK